MKFPITMLEFMHQFPDDGACRAYLEKMRWPNGFVCLRCPAWGSFALFKVNLTESAYPIRSADDHAASSGGIS